MLSDAEADSGLRNTDDGEGVAATAAAELLSRCSRKETAGLSDSTSRKESVVLEGGGVVTSEGKGGRKSEKEEEGGAAGMDRARKGWRIP